MDKIFGIGNFTFRVCCPDEVKPPEKFMKFECSGHHGEGQSTGGPGTVYAEYTYNIKVSDRLTQPDGQIVARRPDLVVFRQDMSMGADAGISTIAGRVSLESRLIGIKGSKGYYACYREVSEDRAEITLVREQIRKMYIDPIFTSLFALERRLVCKGSMVLHCAYVEYQGQAILFSAPSETGKTTQANLWEKYRGSRTINGDRALLGKKDGKWSAQGWPVCGTSEVCNNEVFPIRAVVMLSQAKENRAERLTPGHAFPLLYSQITVNKWNMEDHVHTMDLMDDFLGNVPVFHLGCTISEEAVECLEEALEL